MIKSKAKNVKGKNTDKKIAQIVLDLYTKDPLYPVIYRGVVAFFTTSGMEDDVNNEIQNEESSFSTVDKTSFPALLLSSTEYTEEEGELSNALSDRYIKAVDIQKNYGISNVTLKARLNSYFILRRVQEGKVGYLGVILNHFNMMGVALYNYFESKEGQNQTDIIKTFSLLKENI